LDREIAQVDPIERAVLRIAAYELLPRPDVPYRVVINEAIETTKRFGSAPGHTHVNGELDRPTAAWRSAGAQAARRPRCPAPSAAPTCCWASVTMPPCCRCRPGTSWCCAPTPWWPACTSPRTPPPPTSAGRRWR